MSHYVSPYAYRLPPDTFLARRDPNWYIGAATSPKPPTFKEQLDLARSAFRELRVIATTVQRASTDPGTAFAGELAVKFASETGPRLVDEAERDQDVAKLVRVQGSTQRIVAALKPEVVPALVSRFMTIVLLGPAGAVVPAETLNRAKEAGMDAADSALEAGKEALKTGAKGVVKLGQEVLDAGLDQAAKKPISTALFVGGALGILALYFYINKR
jgi:hypothetical protein